MHRVPEHPLVHICRIALAVQQIIDARLVGHLEAIGAGVGENLVEFPEGVELDDLGGSQKRVQLGQPQTEEIIESLGQKGHVILFLGTKERRRLAEIRHIGDQKMLRAQRSQIPNSGQDIIDSIVDQIVECPRRTRRTTKSCSRQLPSCLGIIEYIVREQPDDEQRSRRIEDRVLSREGLQLPVVAQVGKDGLQGNRHAWIH